MVFPLIPIAGAAIAGGIGGGILGSLFGGSKKDELIQQQQPTIDVVVEAEPYQYYSPQQTYQPTYTQTYTGGDIIVESPGARTTKKTVVDVEPRVDQRGEWDLGATVTPTQEVAQEAGIGEGTNMAVIALIAAVGIIGYGLLQPKGNKKK